MRCAHCLKNPEYVQMLGFWVYKGRVIGYALCPKCTREASIEEHMEAIATTVEENILSGKLKIKDGLAE